MKKLFKSSLLLSACCLALLSCNKTRFYTNRLDGEDWSATELSVDGVSQSELPFWKLSECNPYKELCSGDWSNHHGGKSIFFWQLRESAKKFEISNQSSTTGNHDTDEAVMQCQFFSGIYDVVKRDKNEMEFTSTNTVGYPGKKVVLKLARGTHDHTH
jgi:hypothetical protein